jgi:hypothetical protein
VETSPRNACNRPFDLIFLSAFCVFPFARVVVLPIPPPSHPLSLGNERREEYRPHSDEIIVFCYLINNSKRVTMNTNEKMDNVGVLSLLVALLSLLIAHPTFYPFFKATKEEWSLARPFCRRRLLPNRMGNCSGVENGSTTTLWEMHIFVFFLQRLVGV